MALGELLNLSNINRLEDLQRREASQVVTGDFEGSVAGSWVRLDETGAGIVSHNDKEYVTKRLGFTSIPAGTAVELSFGNVFTILSGDMAINKPAISTSDSAAEAQAFRLEMITGGQPDLSPGAILDPPQVPNRLYGWYNGFSDMVELFMVNSAGTRYVRVTTFND